MEDLKTKNDSKMRKALSWIPGTDRVPTRLMKRMSMDSKEHPISRPSFLPSILEGCLASSRRNSSSPTGVVLAQRPPPFFHSRPLKRTPKKENGGSVDEIVDPSLDSIKSDEIAQWRVQKSPPGPKRPQTRFGFLKSFLQLDKIHPSTLASPGQEDRSFATTYDNYLSVEYPRDASSFPILCDHPFATPVCGSQSFTRSLDLNILSPPPRPKRESIQPVNTLVPHESSTDIGGLPGIDPAKWAEISISAADLVKHYGRERVLFGAALQCPSDDSLEKEEKGLGDLSFVEMEDACGPLQSSPYPVGKVLRSKSHEIDSSVTASSMAGSMTSLSKWPLPPQYEKFEPKSILPKHSSTKSLPSPIISFPFSFA